MMTWPEDHPEFADCVCNLADEYLDENDPFWDDFWRLKSVSELDQRGTGGA